MYTSPIGTIIRNYDISFHAYADDIQLYAVFDPTTPGDFQRILERLSSCVYSINNWMAQNMLQLNTDKTELYIFASNRVLSSLPDLSLKLGDISIPASTSIKNLGVILDGSLNMSGHVSSLCKTVNFHLRNLWRIQGKQLVIVKN